MPDGVIIALGFAFAVIVLAIVVTRLTSRARREHHDRNASRRDGDAVATWVGMKLPRGHDDFTD